jgi:hypothetical protein
MGQMPDGIRKMGVGVHNVQFVHKHPSMSASYNHLMKEKWAEWAEGMVDTKETALDAGDIREALITALKIEHSNCIEPEVTESLPDVESDIARERELDVPDVMGAINDGWCRVFAERVYIRLGRPENVSIESDGLNHTWLEHNGLCYDADCHKRVSHPSMLSVYS